VSQNTKNATRFLDMSQTMTYHHNMWQKPTFDNTSWPAWHLEVPYNDLPLLPPRINLETVPVLKRCIAARAAVAEGTATWTTAKIDSICGLMATTVEHVEMRLL